jgi:hypothetical protein
MSEPKKRTIGLDGHFLVADLYEYPSGERRIDAVYLESVKKRDVILTEHFASHDLLYKAFVEGHLAADLGARARKLMPAIGMREQNNLAEMAPLQFEAQDVRCDYCGARPGEPCPGNPEHCREGRVEGLHHFLIWLAEQRHQTKMTKKLIIGIAEMLGYNTAENLYYRDHGVVVTSWSTGHSYRLYVGGRIDPTKSVWMTSRGDTSNPEHGPFKHANEIALAIRAVGREQ